MGRHRFNAGKNLPQRNGQDTYAMPLWVTVETRDANRLIIGCESGIEFLDEAQAIASTEVFVNDNSVGIIAIVRNGSTELYVQVDATMVAGDVIFVRINWPVAGMYSGMFGGQLNFYSSAVKNTLV